jgi:hypothetical protein
MAMPILLGYLLAASGNRYLRGTRNTRLQILIVFSIYAMASLARIILRVRSGGAYSSYLIPVSVILFTYFLVQIFPGFLPSSRARLIAHKIVLGAIVAWLAWTGIVISYRYRTKDTYAISGARGTMLTQPELGRAFDEAIQFINTRTRPGDALAVLPEGTSLDFLTDRRNPLREEIVTPGFLDRDGEQRAIRQLEESDTRVILIANRATPEFGPTSFGADYCRDLMNWIHNNYGDKTFFIKAYLRNADSTAGGTRAGAGSSRSSWSLGKLRSE